MSRKLLKTEEKMNRSDAAAKLHNLADKINEGKLKLSNGKDNVELIPANRLEFELEVEEETSGETSIEIELEWQEGSDEETLEIE